MSETCRLCDSCQGIANDGLVHNIIRSVQFGELQNEIFSFILKLVLLERSESKPDADAGGCSG